ncbi:MAG: DNA polymerase III subunit delta [Rubrivivax sp.]|nr:MAG: DNA polymerase III subunit delta [Rubrivivax sp.]
MAAIYPNQLGQRLNPLPPLVLLWGDDAGALRHVAQQVIAATKIDVSDPFAAEKITLTDLLAEPSRLADSAQTLSFTSLHKLIHIQGISGDESAATLTALTQAVKTALEFNLTAVTIVLAVPRALEKSSPLVKAVDAHPTALSVRFFVDNASDITQFLKTEFNAAGVPVTADALQQMASGLGADRELARREVEKLIVYAGGESPITEDHVIASLAGAIPADAFRLAEAVGSRSRSETDRLLQHLIHQGEDLTSAFTLTLRHLQNFSTAQTMQRASQPESEILKVTGKFKAPSHVQRAFLQQAQAYPAGRLATLADYALDTLSQARSGHYDATLVFSRALLGLSA